MASIPFRRQFLLASLATCIVAFNPTWGLSQGVLDLNDSDAIFVPDFSKGHDFAYYYDAVRSGYNGGDWLGTVGITSSMAATNTTTSLNIVNNTVLGLATFAGRAVNSNDILLKYTYYGDIDINGQVDGEDLTVFSNNFGRLSGVTQVDGDIDFDNDVDGEDLTVFANNFGRGVGNPLSGGAAAAVAPAAVPEPATLALGLAALAIATAARMARKSRRA